MASILPVTPTKNLFSDVNMGLKDENNYELVFDETSVEKSIITILSTKVGSRVFRRDFGSVLDDILFDPMDDITVERIKMGIIDAVSRWETRIEVQSSEVKPDYDNRQYFVRLIYIIPSLNNKQVNFVFNLKGG